MRRSGTPRRPAWHCAGLGLAESGLVDTTDTDTVNLVVTENFTDFASAASVANTSYSNVAPSVSGAGGTNEVDFSITFAATSDDGDLVANAVVAGFETLVLDFRYLGTPFLTGASSVRPSNVSDGTAAAKVLSNVVDWIPAT